MEAPNNNLVKVGSIGPPAILPMCMLRPRDNIGAAALMTGLENKESIIDNYK